MTDSQDGGSQWTWLSPDDGYKYNDVEISQEGMLTEPLSFPPTGSLPSVSSLPVPATEPRPNPELAKSANDEALGFTETVPYKPYIGQRPAGYRRAKVPDLEKGLISEEPTSVNGHGHQGPNSSQTSGWQPFGNPANQQKKTDLRYVKLNWKMAHDELLLNIGPPKTEPSEAELPKRVLWRHSEHKIMSIKKLQESLDHFESRGLSKGEVALTRRLLKRVHTISERQFVGGSFLTPSASRYDSQDISKYTVDKTCIFFNFPYLCVANSRTRVYLKKGELEHPPRTLLQSHYRLNKTKERDKKQCIGLLKENVVRSCINEPDAIKGRASRKLTEEMIFVPQFWGLIVGLDTMITCGPIDDTALRSSAIQLTEPSSASDGDILSLVRILFTDQGRLEDLLYPIEQCDSWFGLLNKQQQILRILGSDRVNGDTDDYKLSHGGELVTIDNWASMLCKSRSSETLDLWMKKDIPQIKVQSAEVSQSLGERPPHQAHDANFLKDQCSHMVTPFLGWPVQDEFGEPDPLLPTDRADKFLRAIYIDLPTGDVMNVQERAMRPKLASAQRIAAKGRTEISQKTSVEVRSRWTTTGVKGISLGLFRYFELILIFFLPEPEKANSAPLETYWGAVDEILEKFSKSNLAQPQEEKYSAMLSSIIFNARRLHHGVYCLGPNKYSPSLPGDGGLSHGAILLAVMVDALGAIFHLLVETVEVFRTDSRQIIDGMMEPESKVSKYGEEACQLLEKARDQLIREADGIASAYSIGPVVTPEAITITILQRLVAGVFRNGSVEIIGLYEECLEYLALKVERQASRKLLQKINAFLEEITIVNHVLEQQIQVLISLRQSLDPATFKTPSIARKLRYNFECKGIDKIVQTIQEQLRYCEELHERAKLLSEQNVQLVETLQDNINKAIFIFTVVTITFLPMGFVAGYFGMNLAGISGTARQASDFWFIAIPVTFGVLVMGSIVALKGEEVFVAVEGIPRRLKGLLSDRE